MTTTPYQARAWWLPGLRPLLRTPERRRSSVQACRGLRRSPQAVPRSRTFRLRRPGLRLYAPFDPDAASRTLRQLTASLRGCTADEAARLMPAIRARLDAVKVDELDGPPLCDVAPLADRLLLFFADYRVPHEVLPAHHERLAVTLWYFDAEEHARAHAKGVAADQIEAREAEALERAIQGIHERYGTHV